MAEQLPQRPLRRWAWQTISRVQRRNEGDSPACVADKAHGMIAQKSAVNAVLVLQEDSGVSLAEVASEHQ